jgi:hypothetical protein
MSYKKASLIICEFIATVVIFLLLYKFFNLSTALPIWIIIVIILVKTMMSHKKSKDKI